jgi:hypothetical protein
MSSKTSAALTTDIGALSGSFTGAITPDMLATILTDMVDSTDTSGTVNASAANQTDFSADTYLTGSSIAIPSGRPPTVGTLYRCTFDMTKTAAGTATPTVIVRFGTAGAVADTARITFTFAAGTAAADSGIFEVFAVVRVAGASTTMAGWCRCTHHLAATGLVSTGASGTGIIFATAAAFDSTVASSTIGTSFNGGASFAGTNTVVRSELVTP